MEEVEEVEEVEELEEETAGELLAELVPSTRDVRGPTPMPPKWKRSACEQPTSN